MARYRAADPEKYRATRRRYLDANHEKVLESARRHRKKNHEKRNESSRIWRKKNRQKVRDYKRQWHAKYPEGGRERAKQYRLDNPEKARGADHIRRARKRNAYIAPVTAANIARMMAQQRGRCPYCRTSIRAGYHVDHYVPLSKGGTHEPANVQLLCPACNQSKGAKLPEVFARERGRLF